LRNSSSRISPGCGLDDGCLDIGLLYHVASPVPKKDVDARDKRGHDEAGWGTR
jgi:hypothetical protein